MPSAREVLDVRLCVFGDSFTVGVGDGTGAGWVGQVMATARPRSPGVELTAYAMGVRRDTTVDLARRWAEEARWRLKDGDHFGTVFAIGVNDVDLHAGRPRVSRERSLELVAEMLDDAQAASWPSLLIGPPPVLDRDLNERAADLATGMAALCAARGVPFVDLTSALGSDEIWGSEVAAGDGFHPSTAGYARMAAAVQPAFDRWLAEIVASPAPALRPEPRHV